MKQDIFDLTGKKALITGGRRGIGAALAIGLAQKGVDIAIIGQAADVGNIQNTIEKLGQKCYYFQVDLKNRDERKNIISKIIDTLGQIDILINNAGYQTVCSIENYSLEMWDDDIELLLTSIFDLSQQVYPFMKKNGGGKIIHIASISSFQGARNIIGYATAKHALVGLTKCMSNEWAKDNININAIAPGIIESDMSKETIKNRAKADVLKGRIPSGRFGLPSDLIGPIIFLCSDASSHIHGTVIPIDGGWLGR